MNSPISAPSPVDPQAEVELPPADLSTNARIVLGKRYLKKDEQGNPIEDPETMFWRVASTIAAVESGYGAAPDEVESLARDFYALMTTRRFEPNSPTLMNAGRPLGQLSACFVLPVEDELSNEENGIYDTLRSMALVHQSGGGTGFGFSRIRPTGDIVKSTTGVASGPVSFMSLYDSSTEVVKQGGCVVPETRVSTNRGVVPIRELGPEDTPADSWHGHATPLQVATDTGAEVSDEFYNHGVAAIRRIRTASGYHLAATMQHRIRVIDEAGGYVWRRMEELRSGDWVVLQKGHLLEPEDYSLPALASKPHFNAKEVRLPAEASEKFGEFLGYLIGDGAFNRYNRGGSTHRLILSVCDAQPDVAEWLLQVMQELFGIGCIENKKEEDGSTNFFFNAATLGNWFEQIGVEKPSAASARVPEIVFRKGIRMARGFLRGLFTADGTSSQEGYPSLSSVSVGLIDDVQQLLLAVGIPSGKSVVENRDSAYGDKPLHRLRIVTQAGMEVFAHNVGFLDARRQALLSAGLNKAWEFNDVIPNQGEALRAAYAGPGRGSGPGRGPRGANRKLYRNIQHYLPGVTAERTLQRSRLADLAQEHEEIRGSTPLMWFLANDQFYDQVEA
ncbi:MAG: intein-containing adenosylcobalamin-dependent ribonucleoside-diphosphate reductase, partial [Gemmatimonadota bacterium]|nr:intein-containing adenosylcobalamin-dependent ribonucleoside-diphosphate reductase [Gemmatimonadota bacterium]